MLLIQCTFNFFFIFLNIVSAIFGNPMRFDLRLNVKKNAHSLYKSQKNKKIKTCLIKNRLKSNKIIAIFKFYIYSENDAR